ncbi:uncharacterized protein VTP21DRAFT_9512 [Calcarisporiella thermophila]|uniref:uncharacterized protein n=1 Tax=Calcarisporiella thermophila TaxID=911321 RepID=UPI003742FCAD
MSRRSLSRATLILLFFSIAFFEAHANVIEYRRQQGEAQEILREVVTATPTAAPTSISNNNNVIAQTTSPSLVTPTSSQAATANTITPSLPFPTTLLITTASSSSGYPSPTGFNSTNRILTEVWTYPTLPESTQAYNVTIVLPCPLSTTNAVLFSSDPQFNAPCNVTLKLRSSCTNGVDATKLIHEGKETFGLMLESGFDSSAEERCIFSLRTVAPTTDELAKTMASWSGTAERWQLSFITYFMFILSLLMVIV